MQKGIYLPTKQNTIILSSFEEYCEILLDGEYKKEKLKNVLTKANLPVLYLDKFSGERLKNICNKGVTKKGIQFELTRSLRKDNDLTNKFIMIVRTCLEKSEEKLS